MATCPCSGMKLKLLFQKFNLSLGKGRDFWRVV